MATNGNDDGYVSDSVMAPPLVLTRTDMQLIRGFGARERELLRALAETRAEMAEFNIEIEARHGLPPGSIGSTHTYDLDAGAIAERWPGVRMRPPLGRVPASESAAVPSGD